MNIRPAISAPLPWLTIVAGRLFGGKRKRTGKKRPFVRLPRSLRVTTEGRWFIGLLLLIGIAAINTGNNLLYLVVATLLSLIILSGILSESTLRGVSVARGLPRHIYKGEPAVVRLRIANRKRFFPSFSFNAAPPPTEGLKGETVYTVKLGPGAEETRTARYTFGRRGRFVLEGTRVRTRFPFGIFEKGKSEGEAVEVIVFPSIREPRIPAVAEGFTARGMASSRRKGSGGQLYGLREYTLSDDARFIHWRSAARGAKLLVKEHEREAENRLMIVFDNHAAPGPDAFEAMVDRAAGLANHYIQKGYPVGLKTLDVEIPPGRGTRKLHRILQTLALIEPSGAPGPASVRVVSL